MLPLDDRIAFLIFAVFTVSWGVAGLRRVVLQILRGPQDSDLRGDRILSRAFYALRTTVSQSRTFQRRPFVSLFHAFIFYGFVFYLLVNLVDAGEGYLPFTITSHSWAGAMYNLAADILSALVLVGVVALVLRRFILPSRRDFGFNSRTLLDSQVRSGSVARDSIIVSAFILFHVGSRLLGDAAQVAATTPDRFRPFASLLSRFIPHEDAASLQVLGYWGALGSVLAFLSYFPYTKHIHILAAPLNYLFTRRANSGQLPLVEIDLSNETQIVGAERLNELVWPRILDAYACIQCNRCQDACPASATAKALSPSAVEINKRMLLNRSGAAASDSPLLQHVLSPESLWACTTCGACMGVCPVQNEPMLDIVDIRRNQVMIQGQFPQQLQSAFRGMERARNPWGISADERLAWAQGLDVKTIEENPAPDLLYWVGCAASYDPQAQKTARAFVQLLQMAGVNFSVLGKKECCTGDSARRAGNEHLYQQLARENIATLNCAAPKQIVVTCPHCLNSLGNEYSQLGGHYNVVHHSTYLNLLMDEGRLPRPERTQRVTYHDPCYLGRHNGVYDAPRNLLRIVGQDFVEMERARENSFCCGAGGAQFWKEEEAGEERISANRYREAQRVLGTQGGTLAVGCPFCKSMLDTNASQDSEEIFHVKDIAEFLLEAMLPAMPPITVETRPSHIEETAGASRLTVSSENRTAERAVQDHGTSPANSEIPAPAVARKKWRPSGAVPADSTIDSPKQAEEEMVPVPTLPAKNTDIGPATPSQRKVWRPKSNPDTGQ